MMEEKLKLLYSWIESWHQVDGYGGFLHHAIHGTVNWYHAKLVPSYTYEPLMNGFINLYESTGNKCWLIKAEKCADELIAILDAANQFKYSGFEFAPKGGSVVHTVNPLFALLKLYEITNKRAYLDVVRKVLESVVCIYWNGHNLSGPFNMTLIVAAAFAEYGRISGNWKLHELYGKECFELVKRHKVGEEGGLAKGLYYRNEGDHSIIFPWYNTVKAIAMLRYGKATNDLYWINEGKTLLKTLSNMLSDDYTYLHSFQRKGNEYVKVDDVMLVAPTSLAITWMIRENILSKDKATNAINAIMKRQQCNGFVLSNVGYDWRSLVGVTAWNCFVFEMLTTTYSLHDEITVPLPVYHNSYGYVLIDETEDVLTIAYLGKPIVSINKKDGSIAHYELSGKVDFEIDRSLMCTRPHIVRYNAQRHYAVSYIDNFGRGIWLESNVGSLKAWSPFNYLDVDGSSKLQNRGKQKYDKWASLLYHVLCPIVYKKAMLNVVMNILHR